MTADDTFEQLLDDLAGETISLRRLLAGLSAESWCTPTPAAGWSVHDQVSHVYYFDQQATLAVRDPDAFARAAAELRQRSRNFTDAVARELRDMPDRELVDAWEAAREEMIEAHRAAGPRLRVPWYGPAMSVMSAATARLMETWAHGVDVADALGAPLEDSTRLGQVADLGYRTLRFSFTHHGRAAPETPVRVELHGPDGSHWELGPPGSPDRVRGRALDFALVVTQRRAVEETALEVSGPVAAEWMEIAQAFAGPPTTRRHAGPSGTVS